MTRERIRVYCAGPLFNEKEREEMGEIARLLEEAGYDTFLPHRDGLELSKCVQEPKQSGVDPETAGRLMSWAIFSLDVYQVLNECQAVVANLNGRVPDEGAVSEAAMAWARGRVVVGYKADTRTVHGGQDNPLVAGLFQFNVCQNVNDIPKAVRHALGNGSNGPRRSTSAPEITACESLGREIWAALQSNRAMGETVAVILKHASEFAASVSPPGGTAKGGNPSGERLPKAKGRGVRETVP